MLPIFLLLTDDNARGHRLMRDLAAAGTFMLRDIFTSPTTSAAQIPRVVISDVDLTRSDTLVPLRLHLAEARKGGAPFLCLLRTDTARANIQASALGASKVLTIGPSTVSVVAALSSLSGQAQAAPSAAIEQISQVKVSIAQMLAVDEPPIPAAAEATTGLILNILTEVGISEWLDLVWKFDNMTLQHCMLVAGLAGAFGQILGFGLSDRHLLTKSALLHDVGKARIPKEILNKPGPLDADEMRVMRRHAELGYEMLSGKGYSDEVMAVVRSHHELLDGSGYPDGLKGDEIPDLVRLVTICDIYAALIERRPYRAPMSADRAYGILVGMTGKLDTAMLGAFRPLANDSLEART